MRIRDADFSKFWHSEKRVSEKISAGTKRKGKSTAKNAKSPAAPFARFGDPLLQQVRTSDYECEDATGFFKESSPS